MFIVNLLSLAKLVNNILAFASHAYAHVYQ
jgi:hypothetical protein